MEREKIARMLLRMAEDVDDGVEAEKKVAMAAKLVKTAGTLLGPGIPDGTGPMSGTGECPYDDEDDEEILTARDRRALFGDEEVVVEDPAFVSKLRALKMSLPRLSRARNKRLMQFGIEMIRPNSTVEDLVDALLRVGV